MDTVAWIVRCVGTIGLVLLVIPVSLMLLCVAPFIWVAMWGAHQIDKWKIRQGNN